MPPTAFDNDRAEATSEWLAGEQTTGKEASFDISYDPANHREA
jgi:hypothetical protein